MKKKKLKTLSINKKKISSLEEKNGIKGGSWFFCHSNISDCLCSGGPSCVGYLQPCGDYLQTNEGPCEGGTAGCHIP